jgi:hypothetical protein
MSIFVLQRYVCYRKPSASVTWETISVPVGLAAYGGQWATTSIPWEKVYSISGITPGMIF